MDGLARRNPDELDASSRRQSVREVVALRAARPAQERFADTAAVVGHDLIPFLFQDENDVDPVLTRHYRVLEELKRYDVLLSNSEATRQDFLNVLKLPSDQVVTIGAGSDPTFFQTAPTHHAFPGFRNERTS